MKKEDKKKKIINAALAVMGEKGKNATISEIAGLAGVPDSIIYHYFKNKKDLFYYGLGEALHNRTSDLKKHLKGIRDPVNQLKKLIWMQMYIHYEPSKVIAFSIFECRSEIGFLKHPVVGNFLRWLNVMEKILREGIAKGQFYSDLNIPVCCEMIFGLLDIKIIQVLTGHQQPDIQSDYKDLLAVVLPMVIADSQCSAAVVDKREAILAAAESVFADKGYDRATTVEIAKSAGVSEGLLYEYFKNKEDILFSSLQHRFQDHLGVLERSIKTVAPARKLRHFMEHHFIMYHRNPKFLKVFISEGIYNPKFYQSSSYANFKQYLKTLDLLIEEGQRDGSFRPDIKPEVFRNLFLGTFCNLALRWHYLAATGKIDIMNNINTAISLMMRVAMKSGVIHDTE